jgi:hypothetical protein
MQLIKLTLTHTQVLFVFVYASLNNVTFVHIWYCFEHITYITNWYLHSAKLFTLIINALFLRLSSLRSVSKWLQFCPETRWIILYRWMCGLLGALHCDYLVVRRMYTSSEGPEEWRSSDAGSIPYPMYARGEYTLPPSGIHHAFSGPPSINSHQVHNQPTKRGFFWWRKLLVVGAWTIWPCLSVSCCLLQIDAFLSLVVSCR